MTGKEKLNVEWIYLTHEDNLSYNELYSALMKRIDENSYKNTNVHTHNKNNDEKQTYESAAVDPKKNPLGERIEDEETEVITTAASCIIYIAIILNLTDS